MRDIVEQVMAGRMSMEEGQSLMEARKERETVVDRQAHAEADAMGRALRMRRPLRG